MTKASCWTHPAFSQVGVCAACLRERLEQLCIEEHYGTPPHRCSFDSNSSASAVAASAAAALPEENGASCTISSMMEADRAEVDYRNGVEVPVEPLPKFASFLQRTHSWSSSRPRRNGFPEVDLGKPRTLARIISGKDVYGNQSLPPSGLLLNEGSCKFDFYETPKGHYKASSWPEIDSHKQHQGDQQRMGSWIASLFGIRSKAKDPKDAKGFKSGELKERRKFFRGLGKKKASASSVDTKTKLEHEEDFASGEQQQQQHQANGTSRVMPLSGNGDYNFHHRPSLTNMRSVNGKQKPPRDSSWPKAWSTPLRKFMHKSPRADVDSESLGAHDEEKSSWSVSSPAPELKRFHPSPAFPTNSSYTAYYRDYGSSWSLHSSPMPGSKARWNQQHHRARPWEASRDNFHLHSSSPFHAAGSNTWNFYLTPLRPVRSTTSRHRT